METRDRRSAIQLKDLWDTSTFFFGLFGSLLGSLPWLSIIKNLFKLEIPGSVGLLLQHYTALRDGAMRPLFDLFGFTIPGVIIDGAIFYVLVALAFVRANQVIRKVDMQSFARDPSGTLDEIRAAGRLHNLSEQRVEYLIRRFNATRTPGWKAWIWFQITTLLVSARWPRVIYRNAKQAILQGGGSRTGMVQVAITFTFLLFAAVGCIFYLVLSRIGI